MTEEAGEVEIRKVTQWDIQEIADLYREGTWWKEEWDPALLPRLIAGSFVFLVAVDPGSGKAVGMGRVISDGISDGYIQDLVIHSGWRGRGIGHAILRRLVSECRDARLSWVGCIAEPGTEEFYYQCGFEPMEGYRPLLHREGPRC
ncbi:MAG: GNAT family N-acetyltransferase [Methanomicrobiaceae archaeon]|nr:GNAT family N-acetyltransferase [Methanomicrobiaceae archaeon]